MISNEPFFAFSSTVEYKKILNLKFRLLKQYSDQFLDRVQIEIGFLHENQIYNWVKSEIYPLFAQESNYVDLNVNIFQKLSEYAKNKIFIHLDENSSLCFNQIRYLFFLLSNFAKYASFIQNPSNFPIFSPQVMPIRSILYDQISSNKIYSDFLPFGSAQCFIELSNRWNKCLVNLRQLLIAESSLLTKEGETEVFFSSLEPIFFLSYPKFNDLIDRNKNMLIQNHILINTLPSQFIQLNELFMGFKRDVQNIEHIFANYQSILIQTLPFDSMFNLLKNENFYLFIHPPEIKIDVNLSNSSHYFNEMIRKVQIQIESLKKNYNDRCQFKQYLKKKYNIANDGGDYQNSTYINFKNIVVLFKEMIENIDVLDECNSSIQNLFPFFANKENYNNSLSRYLGSCHVNNQIECFQSIIDERNEEISTIQNEILENTQTTHLLQQNLAILDNYKEQIVQCQLCQTNRNYVLANCGHTFCDSCYQNLCLLPPEHRRCPFCQTPFTFNTIIKINWLSVKVNEEETEEEDLYN